MAGSIPRHATRPDPSGGVRAGVALRAPRPLPTRRRLSCSRLICPVLVRKQTPLASSRDRRLCAHTRRSASLPTFPGADIRSFVSAGRDRWEPAFPRRRRPAPRRVRSLQFEMPLPADERRVDRRARRDAAIAPPLGFAVELDGRTPADARQRGPELLDGRRVGVAQPGLAASVCRATALNTVPAARLSASLWIAVTLLAASSPLMPPNTRLLTARGWPPRRLASLPLPPRRHRTDAAVAPRRGWAGWTKRLHGPRPHFARSGARRSAAPAS